MVAKFLEPRPALAFLAPPWAQPHLGQGTADWHSLQPLAPAGLWSRRPPSVVALWEVVRPCP